MPLLITGTASNVELMEAMKKLDADLVALFATAASAEPLKIRKQQEVLWPGAEPEQTAQESEDDELVMTPELFRSCNALQLHLEALTLQPEGTQRMELVQNEVRPIFTVECQLSGDLIRKVPRQPMFHIMQFESEKFQSLTQCTRFGQTAQRQVDMEDKSLQDPEQSAGHVDITVWWREPGTCLNEMLGMGRLELRELYRASLLEQCKCIAIRRRDVHLGSVYLKISLLQNLNGSPEQPQQQQQQPGQKNESGNKAAGEYIWLMSCGRQSQEPLILGPPNRIHLILAEPHDYSHNNYQFYHQAEQQMLYKYQIYTSRPQPRPRLLHLLYMLLIAVIQVLPIILSINTFHFQKRKQNKTKNHQQNQKKKKQICFVFYVFSIPALI